MSKVSNEIMDVVAGFITRVASGVLAPAGLTPHEVILASHIQMGNKEKHPQSVSSLANLLGVHRDKVENILKSLTKKGVLRMIPQGQGRPTQVQFPIAPIPKYISEYYGAFASEIVRAACELIRNDQAFAEKMAYVLLEISNKDQDIAERIRSIMN